MLRRIATGMSQKTQAQKDCGKNSQSGGHLPHEQAADGQNAGSLAEYPRQWCG
jgi:hypothetical protein